MAGFNNAGPVPIDSPAYVRRGFEALAEAELKRDNWVLLLGPRQHGKTTGILRVLLSLEDAGLITTSVDLQALPPQKSYADLLNAIAKQLHRNCSGERLAFIPPTDDEYLVDWLEACLPGGNTPVVIAIDEAAAIRDDTFRNSFYGQIRAISTERAKVDLGGISRRVRFLFSGTFRPESMVDPKNSPFNVCTRVLTDDVTIEGANDLANQVRPDLAPHVGPVYAYVGGQPYLLQTVMRRLASANASPSAGQVSDELSQLGNHTHDHLESMLTKVLEDERLTTIVRNIRSGGPISLLPANKDQNYLEVLGLVNRDATVLDFRCEFYRSIVAQSSEFEPAGTVSDREPQRHALALLSPDALLHMRDDVFRGVALSQHNAAVVCYQNGYYRLSLVGFGAAMEALLLDWLLAESAAGLAAAVSAGLAERSVGKKVDWNRQYEVDTDPNTWRLVNMINVTRQFAVGSLPLEPSHALREWRNAVHPAVARAQYPEESVLEGDCVAAAGLFKTLLDRTISNYGTL